MRVLIACEFSGVVRDAFISQGHDATSCDLLPSESSNGPHLQRDVREIIDDDWDLLIAHPPCTYLCNSGVRWLYEQHGRWEKMKEAARFFKYLLYAPILRVAVENPIPHKYAVREIGATYTQLIQPWQFGHGETKATCLWLRNLPHLEPTDVVEGRTHRMAPSKNRSRKRSITYQGIAMAMADQWGSLS
jgi:hypothetical protein